MNPDTDWEICELCYWCNEVGECRNPNRGDPVWYPEDCPDFEEG